MTREELDELDIIIRDLRMAMDIKEEIANGMERVLVSFADGTKISLPIPRVQKDQLDAKIVELELLITQKIPSLGIADIK